jgi:hypothetical protein
LLDLRHELIEGRADVPRVGSGIELETIPWYAVVDGEGTALMAQADAVEDLN